MGNISALSLLAVLAWQIVAPEGSRPSQILGQAFYEIWHEPGLRAEVRTAEIERCTLLLEGLKELQLAHSERVGSTAQLSVLGSVGLAVIYDALGDRAAALFPRKTAIEELNTAQKLSMLEEYTRGLRDGHIVPQGAC